ncbi:MAG: nucleotidyl transferase AbiEii/AbiGii toxin family protein [Bacteroidetes bacterium]|nr:nucleotidyl transferase AbiEii/AbiGii toxin family protein [Bacteroidota bacterium]
MAGLFLHRHKDFPDLLRILGRDMSIDPYLVEKDYWIMQVLYGLQQLGLAFELKGGTSLSKAFGVIFRFSEDIDILIHPPTELKVNENPKNTKTNAVTSRRDFYDWLAGHLHIDGIVTVKRDYEFDDPNYYRSGGIRLHYESYSSPLEGVKDGILLEVGFDDTSPNQPVTIGSWAYEKATAITGLNLIDNRAKDTVCYNFEYTFVEKLQTIATKFRREQEGAEERPNFMRQYYDVYCLLSRQEVQAFIGTEAYRQHKTKRFPAADRAIPVAQNQAFLLEDPAIREEYQKRYKRTAAIYYRGQPPFDELLDRIRQNLHKL